METTEFSTITLTTTSAMTVTTMVTATVTAMASTVSVAADTLVDEAAKLTEPGVFMIIRKHTPEFLLLVGDPMQLGRMTTALLREALIHGTRSWEVVVQRCLSLCLMAALACRAGEATKSSMYDNMAPSRSTPKEQNRAPSQSHGEACFSPRRSARSGKGVGV
ncbi:hypothetical protein C8A03DRAFT_29280 [Achaetomium macrosporum]|uniref:(+)RNA virus helicase C-terminal domain-containing protein n=1 Tax=Achaetomium macrosporum TaxID=79813 RepID=A0AAN7CI72_9PEZI|nr:hypothetical protein C8A03DRAFT_29280 [Achaetomium macrosporum]